MTGRSGQLALALSTVVTLTQGGQAQPSAQGPVPEQPPAQPGAGDELPDEVPPPPPDDTSAPVGYQADAPAAGAPAGSEAACAPPCRAGFVCLKGQCVSACNPPCASGERCMDGGQCIQTAPPTEPPRSASPPPPPSIFSSTDGGNGAPETPPRDPTVEAHDGFMLRLALGFGGGSAEYSVLGTDVSLSGGGGTFSFDIGGSVAENLVVHARLADVLLSDLNVRVDGEEVTTLDDARLLAVLIGPAVTYYFMPINIYLTGALGLAIGDQSDGRGDDDRDDERARGGWGLNLAVGKEWWAGDQWGLGAVLTYWHSQIPDRTVGGDDVTVALNAVTLAFSATYQ